MCEAPADSFGGCFVVGLSCQVFARKPGGSLSVQWSAACFERNNRRTAKKEVASFLWRVYWFAPFGALASTGCRLMDLTLEDLKIEISPSWGD
jgi:hypothetical protein